MSLLYLLEAPRTNGLTLPVADRTTLMVLGSFAHSLAHVVTPCSTAASGVCVLLGDSMHRAGYGVTELERPLSIFLTSLVQDYVCANRGNSERIHNLHHALLYYDSVDVQQVVGLVAYCCTDYFEHSEEGIASFLNYPIPGGRSAYMSGVRWYGAQKEYRKDLAGALSRALRRYVNGQSIINNV